MQFLFFFFLCSIGPNGMYFKTLFTNRGVFFQLKYLSYFQKTENAAFWPLSVRTLTQLTSTFT